MSRPPQKETSQIPAFRLTVTRQMADYRRRLAERIEHELQAKSLSREALAHRAGVSEKTVKRLLEQKTDNPRPVTIRRLAEALEVDPTVLRPPPELEADQLNRIERKLNRLLEWAEGRTIEEIEDDLASDEGQEPRPSEEPGG
jgi:transcriptional regulator with XRE-family HTH domain